MTEPRRLLTRLLEYIEEQAKEIDPRQSCLGNAKGFIRRSDAIAGLPGVEYDIRVEGDHIWLRVARFTPTNAPAVPDQFRTFIRAANDPDGSPRHSMMRPSANGSTKPPTARPPIAVPSWKSKAAPQ